jgi:tetratricopeptide (TPR) repeat protein
MRRFHAASCAVWLAFLSAAQAQPHGADASSESSSASADGENQDRKASARAHFRLGVDFYRERNFRAALIEFQRAYDDAPHYKLLYNLGQASLELQEYAGAIDYLSAYLKEGSAEIAPERRAEVEQTIRYLESRIAHVTITSNRDGAEVYVDDTLVGRVPLAEPVRVGAGRHKFTAVREGSQPVERMVDVAAQEQREIRLEFEEPGADTAAVSAQLPAPVQSDETASTAPIWVGMATAMLGAGAITMSVLAALAQKDYEDELDTITTKDKLETLRDDAETKALVTDIAWGATLVAGGITAVLILTADGEPETERAERGVDVRVGLAAVRVDGRF